jgi:subtilisin family serine protease
LVALGAAVLAAVLAAAVPAAATPGPANAPEYWFDSWQIESLWAAGFRGQHMTIAEIDTGVNADLPELRGRILPGKDFGEDGDGRVDRERDEFGHGTALASIMVGRPGLLDITGIAPGAKILPIAVPLNGTTDAGQPDRVPEAIRYAANHHAQIINLSLGGKRSPKFDNQPCNDEEQSAIYYALRKGALIVASVGNTGPRKNTIEDPGVCLGVLSVGAVDASGTVASFSARQPYLTLVAPGVDIPSLSRVPGLAFSGDGTSQATAITSAVAALVWSAHPDLDGRGVATRILATLDARRSTPSLAYGYGLLDGYRAVTAPVPADAPNPVFDAVTPFLSRVDAIHAQRATPPQPAAKPGVSLGTFRRGSVSWFTDRIAEGIALAAAGVVLLVVLLVSGIRSRRRRTVASLPRVGEPDDSAAIRQPQYYLPWEPPYPPHPKPGPRDLP